jgi:hypothetical protein
MEKAEQLTDLAGSTLAAALEVRDTNPRAAAHLAEAGKVYATLADIVSHGVPQRQFVTGALARADLHNAEAGVESCAALVLGLLYGRA